MTEFGVYGKLLPDDPKLGIVIINNYEQTEFNKDLYLQVTEFNGYSVALLSHGQSVVVKDIESVAFKWVRLNTVYEEDYKDG